MTTVKRADAGTRVVVRAVLYYIVLIGGATLLWRFLPHGSPEIPASLEALMGSGGTPEPRVVPPLDEVSLAVTVAVAMTAAVLLSLPVAWVYLLTRAKRGYQQSVVQLLVILPTVVAGIVLLVKSSLALAFSLAGIVAAVRFRNTLDDSKDAVYVFLATAIGLSSAVNLPVAAVLSVLFNAVTLVLWYTDFGSAPVEMDGRIAEQRLRRAKNLARTGTFVARVDDEVLEGIAERAWKRAQANHQTSEMPVVQEERILRVQTDDATALRRVLEPRLQEFTKSWRFGSMESNDGTSVLEYRIQLRKKTGPEDLLALVRAAGATQIASAEVV